MWNNCCTQLNVNSTRGALKNSIKTILMNDYATLVKCENSRCIDISINNLMFKYRHGPRPFVSCFSVAL